MPPRMRLAVISEDHGVFKGSEGQRISREIVEAGSSLLGNFGCSGRQRCRDLDLRFDVSD